MEMLSKMNFKLCRSILPANFPPSPCPGGKNVLTEHVGTKPNMSLTWSREFNDENDDLTRNDDDENGEMAANFLYLHSHLDKIEKQKLSIQKP